MSGTERDIVIVGAGGHGRVVLDICRVLGRNVRSFLEKAPEPRQEINGIPVLGEDSFLSGKESLAQYELALALGDQKARRTAALRILSLGGALATLIHPSCVVSETARIGAGTILAPGAIVNADARIGRFCIINSGAIVEHDNILEDGVQICPGANLAGNVHCGEDVFVGTGASIIPGVRIGPHSIIGAGAVIMEDAPGDVTLLGVPGQISPTANKMAG